MSFLVFEPKHEIQKIGTIEIRWYPESPDAGLLCECSLCLEPIVGEVPIRMLDEDSNMESRFHTRCYNKLCELGLIENDQEDGINY